MDGRGPSEGGRTHDGWVAIYGTPPWCWPPTVTRQQSIRDLRLIQARMMGMGGD
jgi:hypothetical protein